MNIAFVLSFLIISSFLVQNICSEQAYRLMHEKAELVFYQKDAVEEDIKLIVKKINTTQISVTFSIKMAIDIVDRKIMSKVSVDRLHGMEYKHSGTSLTSNLCENWQKNAFGMKDMISKYGNLDVCTLKKGVTYYVNDFIADSSNFPTFLPYGSYKIVIDIYYQNTTITYPLFLIHWYAKVEKLMKF
ncbi:uncharacterized protein LOC123680978 [Harmonia axyridis]|uniref:uncharacterized protein LOC123680978 n=1 Tax=Harmonia axyridis TaxID=115357 RepID=UPI001E2784F0|nr:uncharacterized protein LOC123680978 [Harmonia axyridis]